MRRRKFRPYHKTNTHVRARAHTHTHRPAQHGTGLHGLLQNLSLGRAGAAGEGAGEIGRGEARDASLTERRRRCVRPAPIMPYSGAAVRLGRPCVVGAVQVAPTPRIRPREVPRHRGSEAHGASKSRPSNLTLALVSYWYGPAACAGRSRYSWHIRMVSARPGARTRLLSTGRPLPAYSRRLVSLQAASSL